MQAAFSNKISMPSNSRNQAQRSLTARSNNFVTFSTGNRQTNSVSNPSSHDHFNHNLPTQTSSNGSLGRPSQVFYEKRTTATTLTGQNLNEHPIPVPRSSSIVY